MLEKCLGIALGCAVAAVLMLAAYSAARHAHAHAQRPPAQRTAVAHAVCSMGPLLSYGQDCA